LLRKVKIDILGVEADVETVASRLRKLLRSEPSPAEALALERTRLRFEMDGQETSMTAAEFVRDLRRLHEAKLSEKLLKVHGSVVPRAEGINPRFTYMLLFLLSVVVMWFGCNNAAKEIVKEEAIYSRERAVNLRIAPYLASKFIVMSVVTILQVAVLMVVLYGSLELLARVVPSYSAPPAEHMLGYAAQFGVLSLLAMVGVALGLLLSACVSSPDRANALLPYVLIPQIILAGGILSVEHGALRVLSMTLSPVYWAYRAIHLGAHELATDFPGYVSYDDGVRLPCLAMAAQLVVLLALTWWFMKQKDV
jgi:hypothetical protein